MSRSLFKKNHLSGRYDTRKGGGEGEGEGKGGEEDRSRLKWSRKPRRWFKLRIENINVVLYKVHAVLVKNQKM